MRLRIVHADRSALFHKGVKRVFADNPDFEFVDHCGYLEQALESLDTHKPNLLLLQQICMIQVTQYKRFVGIGSSRYPMKLLF